MKCLFIILLFSSVVGYSQSALEIKLDSLKEIGQRPKIGLALSGGAAHGLSHVGVIKYIEENNIPIDYVTGTSMGAIVGGLYAMGFSIEEMDKIVRENDWEEIITNKITLDELRIVEKKHHEKIPLSLNIEGNKVLLPKAFFEGYKLDLKIAEMFSPAYSANNFSELPRPFKTYSVDLLTGRLHEFTEGSLSQAIRASMAIPSIFTPVLLDSMLLVDGGLIKNFPAKEVRDLGADIVIGVYVGSQSMQVDDVKSISDVLKLTGFLTSLADTEEQKQNCDIYIEPDVKNYPILNFNNYSELKSLGYATAIEKAAAFKTLAEAVSDYEYPPILSLKFPPDIFIEEVNVDRQYNVYDNIIYDKLSSLSRGNHSLEEINEAIVNAFNSNDLEGLTYNFREGDLGQILDVEYRIKKKAKVGMTLNHFANTNTAFILKGELRNILFPLTVARSYLRISDNPGISLEFLKKLGKNRDVIIGMDGKIARMNDPIYVNGLLAKQLLINDFKIGVTASKIIENDLLLKLSYSLHNRNVKTKEFRQNQLNDYDQNLQRLEFITEYNSLETWAFPAKGFWLIGDAAYLHNLVSEVSFSSERAEENIGIPLDNNNLVLYGAAKSYYPITSKLIGESSAAVGIASKVSLVDFFRVGGSETMDIYELPFTGSVQGEFRAKEFIYFRQAFRYNMTDVFNFSIIANYIKYKSFNRTFISRSVRPRFDEELGLGISLGYKSIIGPINLDFGINTETNNFNANVGVGYRLIL